MIGSSSLVERVENQLLATGWSQDAVSGKWYKLSDLEHGRMGIYTLGEAAEKELGVRF